MKMRQNLAFFAVLKSTDFLRHVVTASVWYTQLLFIVDGALLNAESIHILDRLQYTIPGQLVQKKAFIIVLNASQQVVHRFTHYRSSTNTVRYYQAALKLRLINQPPRHPRGAGRPYDAAYRAHRIYSDWKVHLLERPLFTSLLSTDH